MSIHVTSWVLRNSPERLGSRLVLIVLSDFAHDDGSEAWPSVSTIAAQARLSVNQARACLRRLEASGAIVRTGKSRSGTFVYRVVMADPPVSVAPETPGSPPTDSVGSPPTVSGGPPPRELVGDPLVVQPPYDPPLTLPARRGSVPSVVARRAVTGDEAILAQDVLERWNAETGQALASQEWLSKIIMRSREHPDLGYDDHVEIILANLHNPWWTGPPTPSVVYGNGAQFERAMLTQAGGPTGGDAAFAVAMDEAHRIEEERR